MAGKDPDLALWYDKNGGYTSSTFYLPALPLWVKDLIKIKCSLLQRQCLVSLERPKCLFKICKK